MNQSITDLADTLYRDIYTPPTEAQRLQYEIGRLEACGWRVADSLPAALHTLGNNGRPPMVDVGGDGYRGERLARAGYDVITLCLRPSDAFQVPPWYTPHCPEKGNHIFVFGDAYIAFRALTPRTLPPGTRVEISSVMEDLQPPHPYRLPLTGEEWACAYAEMMHAIAQALSQGSSIEVLEPLSGLRHIQQILSCRENVLHMKMTLLLRKEADSRSHYIDQYPGVKEDEEVPMLTITV